MLNITDSVRFINDGPFFAKHPDVYPNVTRFEQRDMSGEIVESWERGEDGRMHETTQRDILRAKIIEAEETLAKLEGKNND